MLKRWTAVILQWEGPETGQLDQGFPWLSLLVLEFHIPMCASLVAFKFTTKFHFALHIRLTAV
jgi:hypothetical protein